jgi:hypothetical protein
VAEAELKADTEMARYQVILAYDGTQLPWEPEAGRIQNGAE